MNALDHLFAKSDDWQGGQANAFLIYKSTSQQLKRKKQHPTPQKKKQHVLQSKKHIIHRIGESSLKKDPDAPEISH